MYTINHLGKENVLGLYPGHRDQLWYNYLVHLHISIKLGFVRCLIHVLSALTISKLITRVVGRPAHASSRQSVYAGACCDVGTR